MAALFNIAFLSLRTFLFLTISLNTTCGPGEVKTLRLGDVDVSERILTVSPEGAKNPERQRAIPLNDYAFAAVEAALERARKLGGHKPEHYLFPYGSKGRIDPTRHQTTFKTAWAGIVRSRGGKALPHVRLQAPRNYRPVGKLQDQ